MYLDLKIYLKLKCPITEQSVMKTCIYVRSTVLSGVEGWEGQGGRCRYQNGQSPHHLIGDTKSLQKFYTR